MLDGLNTKLTGVRVNGHDEVSCGLCTGHNILCSACLWGKALM